MCHHSTVTLPPEEAEELLPLPPPQALRRGAPRAVTAVADRKVRRERDCSPAIRISLGGGGLDRRGEHSDNFRNVSSCWLSPYSKIGRKKRSTPRSEFPELRVS